MKFNLKNFKKLKVLFLFNLLLMFVLPAKAIEGEVQFGSDISMFVGVRGKMYLPSNFSISTGLGMAPSFLVEMQSSMNSSVGFINKLDALMFDDMLSNSFYFELRGGWSIDGKNGFFFEAGYAYLGNGGRESSEAAIEDALDENLSASLFTNQTVDASASLHMLGVYAGYNWPLSESWAISASGGIIKPLSSSTNLKFSTESAQRTNIENRVQDRMSSAFSSMVLITANAWIGYRF